VEMNAPNSYVECVNCHNPHLVNATDQVTNPDDKNQLWAPGNETAFCLACHDGAPPAGVTFPATSLGTGFDKSAYVNSTHDSNLRNYGCRHCHDEHGSTYEFNLVAQYVMNDYNVYTFNDGDYALCFACHVETGVAITDGSNNPGKAFNAFEDLHEKHVFKEDAPCILCHDAHAPWDAGEPGLISFDMAISDRYDNYDFLFSSGSDRSSAFYVAAKNGCYVNCHGKDHKPKDYTPAPAPNTDCTACHLLGPPPPAFFAAMPLPLAIELGVPLGSGVQPTATPVPADLPPPAPTDPPPPIIVTATPVP